MARLTFLQIRTQGSIIGGNETVDEWVKRKMNAWLRKHYAAYAWPFLTAQATGLTLSSGSQGTDYGGGEGGLSRQITRIFSPVYFRANGYSTRGSAPVRQLVGDSDWRAIGQVDSTNQVGSPQSFVVLPGQTSTGLHLMTLVPYPVPDKDYTLAFTYQYLPNDLADSDIPLYPNEMTLLQVAKCASIEYDSSNTDLFRTESDILAQMVAADRDTYGGTPSYGDSHQLDSTVFR